MIFHPHQKDIIDLTPRLIMNGTEIERVKTFDFLGVTLDENLTWKPHTDKVATKLSKYSGIMNKLKNYLPRYIMKALYNSLVQSHLNYAILMWGFKCNRLVKLQKRLVRIITCSKYNAHTDPLFKSTEILKVANILDLNALKIYYMENCHHIFIASISWRKDHNTHTTHVKVNKLELSAHEPNIVTTD